MSSFIDLIVNPSYQSYYNLNVGSKLEFSFLANWSYNAQFDPTLDNHDPSKMPTLIYASQNFSTSSYDDTTQTFLTTSYKKEFFASIAYTKGSTWQVGVSTGYSISELNEDESVKTVLIPPTWESPTALEGQNGITQNENVSVELSFSENSLNATIIQYDISTGTNQTFSFYQDFTNSYAPLFFSFCGGITFCPNATNTSIFTMPTHLNYYYVFNNNNGNLVSPLTTNSSNLLPYAYLQIPFENLSSFYPLTAHRLNIFNGEEFLHRKSTGNSLSTLDYYNAGTLFIDPSLATYSIPFDTNLITGKNYLTLSFWESLNLDHLTYNDDATSFQDITLFELLDTGNKISLFSCILHTDDTDPSNIIYQTILRYKDSSGTAKTFQNTYTNAEPLFISLSMDVAKKELSLSILNSEATESTITTNTVVFPITLTATTSFVFGDSINTLSYSGPLLNLYSISLFNNCHFYNGILNMPSWGANFIPQNAEGNAPYYATAMLYLLYGGTSSSFQYLLDLYLSHKEIGAVL